MSLSAAAILILAEKGLSAHEIAEVAAACEPVKAPRSANAERQARFRERKRASVTCNVTSNVTDVTETPSLSPSPFFPPDPQTNPTPMPTPVCVSRARGWHRMPEGWRPAKPFPEALKAKVEQWPPGKLDDEIAALKRWAANAEDKNGKGRKLDWDKALWNWLGRVHDERQSRQQRHPHLGKTTAALAALGGSDDHRPM